MNDSKFVAYADWNSFYSQKFKLFYVATPKVACTSLKWWLAELEGYAQSIRTFKKSAETAPDLIIHDGFSRLAPHIAGVTKEQLLDLSQNDSVFRFAVVRNPYKRIFSAWQSKLLLQEPLQSGPYLRSVFFNQKINQKIDLALVFEAFLEHLQANEKPNFWDCHWTPQYDLLRPDLFHYSMVAKIEDPKKLNKALAQHMGVNYIDPFAIRYTNESLIPYLEEFITPRSAELIRNLYAKDFEVFNYSLDIPKSKETFTEEQLQLAMRSIDVIRGRHRRFAEIRQVYAEENDLLSKEHAEQLRLAQKRLEWLANERGAWMNMTQTKIEEMSLLQKNIEWLAREREAWMNMTQTKMEEMSLLQKNIEWLAHEREAWMNMTQTKMEEMSLLQKNIEWLAHEREAWMNMTQTKMEEMSLLQKNIEWLAHEREAWMNMTQTKMEEMSLLQKNIEWLAHEREAWMNMTQTKMEEMSLLQKNIEWLAHEREAWMNMTQTKMEEMSLLQKNIEWLAHEREAWMNMTRMKIKEIELINKTP